MNLPSTARLVIAESAPPTDEFESIGRPFIGDDISRRECGENASRRSNRTSPLCRGRVRARCVWRGSRRPVLRPTSDRPATGELPQGPSPVPGGAACALQRAKLPYPVPSENFTSTVYDGYVFVTRQPVTFIT